MVVGLKVSTSDGRRMMTFAIARKVAENGHVALLFSTTGAVTVTKEVDGSYSVANATLLEEPPWATGLRRALTLARSR